MAKNGAGAAAAATAKDRKPTSYVVLKQSDGERELWEPVATLDAKNASDAEKKAALQLGKDGLYAEGAYKAVAASSWDGGQAFWNETKPTPKSRPLNGDAPEQPVLSSVGAEGGSDGD